MPRSLLPAVIIILCLVAGCNSDGLIAPGGNNTPPDWIGASGITSVVPGERSVIVHWGEAIDMQDPPVSYLLYSDTDGSPFDQLPISLMDTTEYTLRPLPYSIAYTFGVRCGDSARPPHVDDNNNVLSAVPLPMGWVATWGGSGGCYGNSAAIDGSGNIYVTGSFWGDMDFDPGWGVDIHTDGGVYLSKIDLNGNFLWARTWGAGVSNSVAIDGSGNVYVTGQFRREVDFDPGQGVDIHTAHSTEGCDIYLSKFDSSGNFLWAKTWGGDGDDHGIGVAIDGYGNIFATGYYDGEVDFDPGSGVDIHIGHGVYLSKIDFSGNFLWAKTWGASESPSLAIDGSGNIYVTGFFGDEVDFDPGQGVDIHTAHYSYDQDAYLSKFDSSGDFLWARTWGGRCYGHSVAVDGSGNIYVTGTSYSETDFDPGPGMEVHTDYGSFLSKFDSSGSFLWARTWGGEGGCYGQSVASDGFGNIFVTGPFRGDVDFDPGPGVDIHMDGGVYLNKVDSSGDFLWARTWGTSSELGLDSGNSVAIDGSGNIYVTGEFEGKDDFDPGAGVHMHKSHYTNDAFLNKICPDGLW